VLNSVAESRNARGFTSEIERWITTAFEDGAHTFTDLLESLPGTDPIQTRDRLEARATAGDDRAAAMLRETRCGHAIRRFEKRLPLPHPLDFDWRFADETVTRLLGELTITSPPAGSVAHLGTPSLFRAAASDHRTHHLLDLRAHLHLARNSARRRSYQIDLLRDEIPAVSAETVIADPPWYPEHIRAYIWAASQILTKGGRLLLSAPPVGARPGIAQQMKRLRSWAEARGMHVIDERPLELRYATPPFERSAFCAAGVEAPNEWRRGDLLVFSWSGRAAAFGRPRVQGSGETWRRFELREIPIFVRERSALPQMVPPNLLQSLVPGDVLKTVSRREPVRDQVAIWSSLNRIYASPAPQLMAVVIHSLERGRNPADCIAAFVNRKLNDLEEESVSQAANKIAELIDTERKEVGLDA
jgi:hypothetical protein